MCRIHFQREMKSIEIRSQLEVANNLNQQKRTEMKYNYQCIQGKEQALLLKGAGSLV